MMQERAAAQLDAMADAIDDGDFEECARLADAGNWPVDWCSTSGNTALVAAARRGAPDAVSRLLRCGAAVDAPAACNETPLSAAATAGHLDVCAALLAAGANPTKVLDQSASLLIAAVVSDEPELVDALLARSASARPAKCTSEPTGAFLVAVELGSAQIVDSFVQRAIKTGALDVDEPHGDIKIRALHAAAARGRADIVQSLLGAGAQVDVLDAEGMSALHYAAGHDHDDVLRVLVSKGADVLRKDAKGNKPLSTAMNHGAKSAESALLMAESMLHPKT
jgi:ankyrin repeat protein